MDDIFNISQCTIAQLIGEASRFMIHVFLLHVITNIVEHKTDIISESLFRTLITTLLAIAVYHLFIRKLIEPVIEKMKSVCLNSPEYIEEEKKHVKKSN